MWTVKYGCKEWQDEQPCWIEREARELYEQLCRQPPIRGGKMVKWIALFDPNGKNVVGFATGGSYGKVA